MTPKQKARREKILNVTMDHLSLYGFESMNMRDLADAADVSPTTLYRLFDSKESLILAAVKDQIEQITTSVSRQEEAGLKRLFTLLRSFAGGFASDPNTTTVIPTLLFMADAGAPATEVLLTNAIRARRLSVIDMQKAGEIDAKCDADHLATQLAMATWGPLLFWAKGFIEIQHLADELVKTSIWSLLPVLTKSGTVQVRAEIKKNPRLAVLKSALPRQRARS